MAAEPKKALTRDEILVELALARQALTADLPELARRCNPADRLRQSVSSHPVAWIAASTIGGLVATKILLSKRDADDSGEVSERADARFLPVLALFLKSAWSVARPALLKVVGEQVARLVEEQETA